jgi:hypothetical protein
MSSHDSTQILNGWRCFLLVAYNLVLASIVCWQLAILLATAPLAPGLEQSPIDPLQQQQLRNGLLSMLATMALAGAAGATLCNLRGIFRWVSQEGGLPTRFETPFYIRPFTGALTGLFTFFVGHLLVASLSERTGTIHWRYLEGRLPYVGFAIVAGFASQEFMQRLKEVAKTLFSESDQHNQKP